jgi:hypothetical protein
MAKNGLVLRSVPRSKSFLKIGFSLVKAKEWLQNKRWTVSARFQAFAIFPIQSLQVVIIGITIKTSIIG